MDPERNILGSIHFRPKSKIGELGCSYGMLDPKTTDTSEPLDYMLELENGELEFNYDMLDPNVTHWNPKTVNWSATMTCSSTGHHTGSPETLNWNPVALYWVQTGTILESK